MKHTFTITTIITLTLLAVLSGCKKDYPSNKHSVGTVKDICGNTYNYVKIGEQYWTAENMRCNKYDTQSEMAGATISTEDGSAPYYKDASSKSNWESTEYAISLTNEQISTLGYLYNWAAAVGVETGDKQTSGFSSKRQGICPNGWHVPNIAEWSILLTYVEKNKGAGTAGTHLKSASGWYNKDSNYKAGLDTYGFTALPSGYAEDSKVSLGEGFVGRDAFFWTSTPDNAYNALSLYLFYADENIHTYSGDNNKSIGFSVRCVKN